MRIFGAMDCRAIALLLLVNQGIFLFITAEKITHGSAWSESTVVQAAGRPAKLGDLYDAIRDDFTGSSSYGEKIPVGAIDIIPKASPPHLSFHLVNSYSERSSHIGLSVSLQASAYLGLTDISGTLQAFSKYRLRQNCVNGLLVYKFQKGVHRLNLRSSLLEDSFIPHAAEHVSGTHVLIEVLYGSEVVIGFNFEVSEHDSQSTVESHVAGEMTRMIQSFGASKSWDASQESFIQRSSMSLEIFGDLEGYAALEPNITEIYKALKEIPKRLSDRKTNGTPLSYRLYSVERVKKILDVESSEERGKAKKRPTRGWRRRQRRMEKMVLSLCYMNDAIKFQYEEEMDRMQKYRTYIPNLTVDDAKSFYVNYTEAYEKKMAVLKDIIISGRSNPEKNINNKMKKQIIFKTSTIGQDVIISDRSNPEKNLNSKVKKIISLFKNSTNGPLEFQKFLKGLSTKMTQITADVNTLLAAGFIWINKTSTADDIASRSPHTTVHMLFVSRKWRNQNYSQFLDCVVTGSKLQTVKYVIDCDFEVQKPSCKNYNETVILEYHNGFTTGTSKCVNREIMASGDFKRAESVLKLAPQFIPRLPFFSS